MTRRAPHPLPRRRRRLSPRARRRLAETLGVSAGVFLLWAQQVSHYPGGTGAVVLLTGPVVGFTLLACAGIARRSLTGLGAVLVLLSVASPCLAPLWIIILGAFGRAVVEAIGPAARGVSRPELIGLAAAGPVFLPLAGGLF